MTTHSRLRQAALCILACIVALVGGCSSSGEDTGSTLSAATLAQLRRPAGVPAEYVATPFGYLDPSCIAPVQRGEIAHPDGTIQSATGATRTAAACTRPRYDSAGRPMPIGSAGAAAIRTATPPPAAAFNGWLENYNTTSTGSLSYLSATWIVPAAPAAPNDGQTIYFFNGLEGLPTVESILQPVLAFSGGHWTATSWNCCAAGTTYTGNTIDVSPGDILAGSVMGTNCNSSGLCENWAIETLDQTTGESSLLETASWGVALNWVFGAVLEVYGVSSCSDLPASGALAFDNQIYTAIAGGSPTANWSYGAPSSSAPSCGYGGQNGGTSVTLGFSGAGSAGVPGPDNFAASCSGVSLSGSTLSASCRNVAQQSLATSLDLDTCFTNDNGSLAHVANGGYAGSCSGCSLSGTNLTCTCYEYTGTGDTTVLDVNQYVSNCNGVLTCGGC